MVGGHVSPRTRTSTKAPTETRIQQMHLKMGAPQQKTGGGGGGFFQGRVPFGANRGVPNMTNISKIRACEVWDVLKRSPKGVELLEEGGVVLVVVMF